MRYPNGKEASSYQNTTVFPTQTDVHTFNKIVVATQQPNPSSSIPYTVSYYSLRQSTRSPNVVTFPRLSIASDSALIASRAFLLSVSRAGHLGRSSQLP